MTISSIIHKELSKEINILWTNCDSIMFKNFLQKTLKCNLVDFDYTYFGGYNIDIVLCNNRLMYLDKCIESAIFFHCPLIIVDHDVKPSMNIENKNFNFSPVLQIATSEEIYKSWNKIADMVLPYRSNDKSLTDKWLSELNNLKRKSLILS
jgi:hypothetical protein